MEPSEILDAAAKLLAPKGAWMQGDFWRTQDGLRWKDLEADERPEVTPVCFCLFGAIAAVTGNINDPDWTPTDRLTPYLKRVIRKRDARGFAEWNDAKRRRQADVVAALRKAAELARSEGQ